MFSKVMFALVVLLIMVAASPPQSRSDTPLELTIVELEEPCVQQGGLCMLIEDCDPGNLVQMRGVLCPTQRHLGVECCYN